MRANESGSRRGPGRWPTVALGFALPALAACAAPQGHYCDLRGIRMYYERTGHGPAVVLLHGGGGSGADFRYQIAALAPRFELIVPDLCAQGRTGDRPEPLSYHALAEDVEALLERLRVPSADVVGWSDGGIVGLDLAIHHPGRVRHLVTFGANFSPDGLTPGEIAWDDTATPESFGDGVRRAYAEKAPDPSHYEAAMGKLLEMWRTQPNFTREQLGSIRARTLICAGEDDVVRREHTEQLAGAIPGAKLWIVPGATHRAMFERAAEVNRVVLDFLEDAKTF